MNINHLKYFLSVAKLQSFTRAADELHISQPSISKMVRDLEDVLDVQLFNRTGKNIALTDAGKMLQLRAQSIVNAFDSLPNSLSDVINLKKGSIRIGIPPIVGASFFPRIIGAFLQEYPGIELDLMEAGSKKIETAVEEFEVDVGIICSAPANPDGFAITPLVCDPLMVVVPHDHHFAAESMVSLDQLKYEKFVLFRGDFSLHDHIINTCRREGFNPHIVCRSSQRDFMIEMVYVKLGITLLPQKTCEELDKKKVRIIPIQNQPLYLNLMLIAKKGQYQSYALREWLAFVEKHIQKGQTTTPLHL